MLRSLRFLNGRVRGRTSIWLPTPSTAFFAGGAVSLRLLPAALGWGGRCRPVDTAFGTLPTAFFAGAAFFAAFFALLFGAGAASSTCPEPASGDNGNKIDST